MIWQKVAQKKNVAKSGKTATMAVVLRILIFIFTLSKNMDFAFLDMIKTPTLKKGVAIHVSILAWRIPWTEEPGGLQSIGSYIVRHD